MDANAVSVAGVHDYVTWARAALEKARVALLGQPGDVLVSRTVVDLVAGFGLEFADRGMHALADGQKSRRVFAVDQPSPTPTHG